jgi:hypothetical protein
MFAPALSLALATALSLAAAAGPLVARDFNQIPASSLSPRSSSERVFLAYCYGGYPGSEMNYYSSDAESRTGQRPDDVAFIGPDAAIITPFEGQTISGTFSSGDVFTSEIAPGAQNLADFEFAGTGRNDYGNFNCYKDDNRLLWEGLDGVYEQVCYSQYYCEDVSFLVEQCVELLLTCSRLDSSVTYKRPIRPWISVTGDMMLLVGH